jgi:GT2 family glycosyltransferase
MISIIIVTFNGEKFIKDLIFSIKAQTYKDYEIIIIDNNSRDKTLKIIEEFKDIKLIKLSENVGYTGALNIGITKSNGEFILILNQDTKLDENFLKNGLNGFKTKNIGFVSGKILRFDKRTIDSTGQYLSPALYPKERGYNKQDNKKKYKNGYIFSVCGAIALYKREMLEELKIDNEIFDNDFFMFFDDIDLCWRANNKGWKGYYIPEAIGYHYRSGTIKSQKKIFLSLKRTPFIQYHIIKNRYLTLLKNVKPLSFLLHLPFILLRDTFYLLIIVFYPSVLIKLIKNYTLFIKAFKKRKIIWK